MAGNFKEFAEDSDVHGIKQITRVHNGWVSNPQEHQVSCDIADR